MTIPSERFRAIDTTREWMRMNAASDKIPKFLRDEMRNLLRHYPSRVELEVMSEQCPGLLASEDEALICFMRWEEENELDSLARQVQEHIRIKPPW